MTSLNSDITINSILPQQIVESTKKERLADIKDELMIAGLQSLIWGGLAYNYNNDEFEGFLAGQIFLGSKLAYIAQKRLGFTPSLPASVITGIVGSLLYQFQNPLILNIPEAWRLSIECATLPVFVIGEGALYASACIAGVVGVAALGAIGVLGARELAKEVDKFKASIHEIKSAQAKVTAPAADAIKELEIV